MAKANSHLKYLINKGAINKGLVVQLGPSLAQAKNRLKTLKQIHRKLVRKSRLELCVARDHKLFNIRSSDPSSAYKDIKRIKNKT